MPSLSPSMYLLILIILILILILSIVITYKQSIFVLILLIKFPPDLYKPTSVFDKIRDNSIVKITLKKKKQKTPT